MAILEHKIEISSYLFFACVGEGENAFWGHLHSLQHNDATLPATIPEGVISILEN